MGNVNHTSLLNALYTYNIEKIKTTVDKSSTNVLDKIIAQNET